MHTASVATAVSVHLVYLARLREAFDRERETLEIAADRTLTVDTLLDALVVHRVGALRPGDQIVLVVITSAHRGMAFDACEYVMDMLKTRAPFWKKERTPQGDRWVEARASDDAAAGRW